MTVDRDTGVSESFVGSGTTGPFAVTNFNIATTDQIEPGGVTKVLNATGVATTLILNDPGANGYTAAISGGLVTINTIGAVASGYTLIVARSTAKLQTVALPIVGRFQPHDVEEALDLQAMQLQELPCEFLGSAEAFASVDQLSVGWAGASRTWAEIEVSLDVESVSAAGAVDLHLSLDGGVSNIVSGYDWVVIQAYGTGFAGTVGSYVSGISTERERWRVTGDVGRVPNNAPDDRLIGNFRISGLVSSRSSKIVGSCTFTTSAGECVHASIGGKLDAQVSLINGIVVKNPVVNQLAIGSKIYVRGIR